ncbi:alanine--tRNA ligase [Marinigracilibium pacificum]|uniref:Alanine--tRNA ligase n=1 Tax=Marinigracilibium pacificum TaxID=2729599 RepID=A0A848J0Q0_9BACT|nr:alanine--tRNA ligase [Marinigracilibium pacificum]NMM49241.1 alanine--tRNA ligase [Marinigracilibium pacificum]
MNSADIRQKFLSFFEGKGHKVVPSAPLVVKNDPTLMFTNAGMNQFKDYFLGNSEPENKRVADTQKCLRVSGKHNDLEEVGIDTYHHTMFEMLGNWSFGDYFKKDAIAWAWELLTEVYGLPKDRLYVTVFGGDKGDNLGFDQDAFDHWKEWISEDRILSADKKDNFWEMGDTGPCGPCSEIHIDLRSEEEVNKLPGKELVNQDHPLVVEIWNLVFMEFNRKADGSLVELPNKHIDTGMGFERLCMAIQKKTSNYDTDVFTPLIKHLEATAKVEYGKDEKIDIALRVIADHIRAISFAIADGQLPSNNKAGYVIRRILRRAVRYGYTFLNLSSPFLYELVDVLANQFDGVFSELKEQQSFVSKVVKEEESNFLRTLENGLKRLEQITSALAQGDQINGKSVFELYDTYGFPVDLTALIAREKGFSIDEAGFEAEMKIQKDRSRQAAAQEKGDWIVVEEGDEVVFTGYEELESNSRLLRYREVKDKKNTIYQLVFEKTPFYAESGGQVGDKGIAIGNEETIQIFDTKKENDLIIHYAKNLPKNLNVEFLLQVDEDKRVRTMNNHSATHLLHAALRNVLGDHVQQRGSLVSPDVLRFDFSHFQKVTEEEIREIEQIVNSRIRQNIKLDEKRNVPIEDAKDAGAMALFGEKYGDFVRVITFDKEYSVELCGGTHVPYTGQIGMFKIISEGSVAAGVRRIEAITGAAALDYFEKELQLLNEVREVLKNPKNLIQGLNGIIEEKNKLAKAVEEANNERSKVVKQQLFDKIESHNGANILAEKVELPDADSLKNIAFQLKNEKGPIVAVIAADIVGKPQIAVVISEDLVNDERNAGQWVRELAKHIKGGGGGQPFFATAGGKDISGLDNAVTEAKKLIKEKL